MKNLKNKRLVGKRGGLGKTILNELIGFDRLSNNTHLINEYYWINHLYPYLSIHGRIWVNLTKWVCLPPILSWKNNEHNTN